MMAEAVRAGARDPELSRSRLLLHSFLFVITAMTTTLTGAALWVVWVKQQPLVELVRQSLSGNFEALANGLLFSFTLLTILAAHEFGHFVACRHYRIRATLPFFIPAPPLLTLFGTFGAVIRIKQQITSRRALFDIGIAGPLAGFVFALPAAILGLVYAQAAAPPAVTEGGGLQFQDPPLFIIITKLVGAPHLIDWNPVYWAAWAALLVTALNLFPVGQLDGGHVVYAITGRRIHRWVGLATSIGVAVLAIAALIVHHSPIWFLWAGVLFFLFRVGHPPVADEIRLADDSAAPPDLSRVAHPPGVDKEPLGPARITLAIAAGIVFLLCFMPFPITS